MDDVASERVAEKTATGEPASAGSPVADSLTCRGQGLAVHFDGVKALDGVDIELRVGEIQGLIGPNGAGKTTLVNTLTGFQRPTSGRVWLGDVEVTDWQPHRLASRGIARTFQSGRSFSDLTVLENVEVGAVGVGAGRRSAKARADQALAEVGLEHRVDELAQSLSSGEERRLQVARALAMRPDFLFLDEPAAGLNETESDDLAQTISALPERLGCGVLVIEHDMRVIMGICERILVLDYGVSISLGTPEEVRRDPNVLVAYLGTDEDGNEPDEPTS